MITTLRLTHLACDLCWLRRTTQVFVAYNDAKSLDGFAPFGEVRKLS